MVKRGKPQGNKRQREQAKARKKRDKEARRQARKEGGGLVIGEEGDEATSERDGEGGPVEGDAAEAGGETAGSSDDERETGASPPTA
jgi:hypothetical protein